MSTIQHREFACAILVSACGRFLLQQRDDLPGILLPGRLGLFGGHREGNETFLQCVAREVSEEVGLVLPPERFEHLAIFAGADPDVQGGTARGECYVLRNVDIDALNVKEGTLFPVDTRMMFPLIPRLTPSARTAISLFLEIDTVHE